MFSALVLLSKLQLFFVTLPLLILLLLLLLLPLLRLLATYGELCAECAAGLTSPCPTSAPNTAGGSIGWSPGNNCPSRFVQPSLSSLRWSVQSLLSLMSIAVDIVEGEDNNEEENEQGNEMGGVGGGIGGHSGDDVEKDEERSEEGSQGGMSLAEGFFARPSTDKTRSRPLFVSASLFPLWQLLLLLRLPQQLIPILCILLPFVLLLLLL